jgi:transposase-like protein
MNCPKCSIEQRVKSGKVKGRQRCKCKECACHYSVELKSKSKAMKKQALYLYLEGWAFRSTGRFLEVSNVSVLNWIRSFGREVQELNSES